MNRTDLRDEIAYQLNQMRVVVRELAALQRDIGNREPTNRELAAASSFLMQFYSGVENILKRVSRHHVRELPSGREWHRLLLHSFGKPAGEGLPELFDESLVSELDVFRRFRHVARAAYGLELEWSKLTGGLDRAGRTFQRFEDAINDYIGR